MTLYQRAVIANPDDFEANLGLFYALVETEELDPATAHIDAYAARLPERRHLDGRYNGERLSADVTAEQARIYSDRLSEAQTRIEARPPPPLQQRSPPVLRILALARGWPGRENKCCAGPRLRSEKSGRARRPRRRPARPAGLAGGPRRD